MYRNDVSPLDGLMLGRLQREVANFTSFFYTNLISFAPPCRQGEYVSNGEREKERENKYIY